MLADVDRPICCSKHCQQDNRNMNDTFSLILIQIHVKEQLMVLKAPWSDF